MAGEVEIYWVLVLQSSMSVTGLKPSVCGVELCLWSWISVLENFRICWVMDSLRPKDLPERLLSSDILW